MNACELGFGMDVGACIGSWLAGFFPDWLQPLLPYWWIVALIAGAGIAYRFAGVPGVAAFSGIVGFIVGRRSVEHHEHVDGIDAKPSPPKPRKRPTIFGKK